MLVVDQRLSETLILVRHSAAISRTNPKEGLVEPDTIDKVRASLIIRPLLQRVHMSDLRVAIATPTFPYPKAGKYPGIERQVLELIGMLRASRCQVTVFTTYWNGGVPSEEVLGMPIRRIADATKLMGRTGAALDLHFVTWGRFVGDAILRDGSFDIAHSLAPLASAGTLRAFGLPLVSHFNHYERIENWSHLLYKPVHHWLERSAYRRSRILIAPSISSARDLSMRLNVSRSSVRVVPHAINVSRFMGQVPTRSDGTVRALFVGIHEERKGIRYLLDAVRLLHDKGLPIGLVTVGGGPLLETLKRNAHQLGISDSVTFRGYLEDPTGKTLPKVYAESDMFVFPSLQEGFGYVLVEAMASALPIISTTASAIPEVVGDAGILVPPRDAIALADAMEALAKDPDLRRSLGRKGRARVLGKFSTGVVSRQLLNLYAEAMGLGVDSR
jgi:glycosyltransferase involved in cell wall biosynthesis